MSEPSVLPQVRARVTDLIPMLQEHAGEVDQLGMLPEEVLAALDGTGVFKLGIPEQFGGLGPVTSRDQLDILVELGKGNASAGWIAWVSWPLPGMVMAFGDQAAEEVFGTEHVGPLLAASALNPAHARGKGRVVDGGLMVSGRWMFASGVRHCAWLFAAASWTGEDGTENRGFVLLERSSFEVADDWHVEGMKGSNTNTAVADTEIFVPSHRVVTMQDFGARSAALDHDIHADLFPTGIGLGAAKAALERFTEQALKRSAWSTPHERLADVTSTQIALAKATADIAMVEATLRHAADTIDLADAGEINLEPNERATLSFTKVHGAHRLREATESLQLAMGSSTAAIDDRLGRAVRDIRVLCLHISVRHEWAAEALGRALFDIQPAGPLLFLAGPGK